MGQIKKRSACKKHNDDAAVRKSSNPLPAVTEVIFSNVIFNSRNSQFQQSQSRRNSNRKMKNLELATIS